MECVIKMEICPFIPPVTHDPSSYLGPNLIPIGWLVREAIRRGKTLHVQHTSLSWSVTNWAPCRVGGMLCICVTVLSQNQATYNYFPVEKSHAAFAIFWVQYQRSPSALQMTSVEVRLSVHPLWNQSWPESSIWLSQPSYHIHGSSLPHPPMRVVSLHEALPPSTEISPCGVVPSWRLWPSPSWVHQLPSAGPAVYHHHLLQLPRRLCSWNLQDYLHCVQCHSTSLQIIFLAFWMSIMHFRHFCYLPSAA